MTRCTFLMLAAMIAMRVGAFAPAFRGTLLADVNGASVTEAAKITTRTVACYFSLSSVRFGCGIAREANG